MVSSKPSLQAVPHSPLLYLCFLSSCFLGDVCERVELAMSQIINNNTVVRQLIGAVWAWCGLMRLINKLLAISSRGCDRCSSQHSKYNRGSGNHGGDVIHILSGNHGGDINPYLNRPPYIRYLTISYYLSRYYHTTILPYHHGDTQQCLALQHSGQKSGRQEGFLRVPKKSYVFLGTH